MGKGRLLDYPPAMDPVWMEAKEGVSRGREVLSPQAKGKKLIPMS